jgi:Tfp pilus assembly protein PilN
MIHINLAPPRKRKRLSISLPGFNLGILFGALSLLSIVAVAGYWWMLSSEAERLEGDLTIATKQLETLKAAIAEGNKYKAERDDLEKRIAAIDELTRTQPKPIYFLDAVADAIPRDLWLSSAGERDRQLRFTGTAFSTTAVADFMSNLRSSGKFKDVDLVVSRQDISKTPRTVTFEVVCRFEI